VPLGAAAIYHTPQKAGLNEPAAPPGRRAIDGFWAAVLLATLFCYAVYPFFPLTPPRVLFADVPGPHVEPLLRKWNFWLLDHYSVQACIFPSGHVAAVTAVALAVRQHAPRAGAVFLFLAGSIAVATVYGRYHYAADAIAGALVAVAAYCASNAIQHRAIT
jgi:membrane-associated phospholipid phosphatase